MTEACPFCGNSGGAVWQLMEDDGRAAWIECAICHARGPRVELKELALPMWNRRRPPNDSAVALDKPRSSDE